MRRGFFRLWLVVSVLWALPWIGIGVSDGMFITPAHEDAANFDRAALGLPANASDMDFKLAILEAGSRGALPKGQLVPAAFNPAGTTGTLAFAASVPVLLLASGWAFAGFSGAVRRG